MVKFLKANFDSECLDAKIFKICVDGRVEIAEIEGEYRIAELGINLYKFIDKVLERGFKVENVIGYRGELSGGMLVPKVKVSVGWAYFNFLLPGYLDFDMKEVYGWVLGSNVVVNSDSFTVVDSAKNLVEIIVAKHKIALPTRSLRYVLSRDKLVFLDLLGDVAFELEPYGYRLYYPGLIGEDLNAEMVLKWFASVLDFNKIDDVEVSDGALLKIGNVWYRYGKNGVIGFGYNGGDLKINFDSFRVEIRGGWNDFSGAVDTKTLKLYLEKLRDKVWGLAKFYLF